jgi:hypothetical protein
MPINKIAYQVLEENQQHSINTLRLGQSVADTGWRTYADAAMSVADQTKWTSDRAAWRSELRNLLEGA